MKRVEVSAQESQTGEVAVQIIAEHDDISRLVNGVAAYQAFLLKMIGYGVRCDQNPDAVQELLNVIAEKAQDIEVVVEGYDSPQIHLGVELSPEQASIAHTVVRTMLAQAVETGYLSMAMAWQGSDDRSSHGWHESPQRAWERFEAALAPPEQAI